MPQNSISICTSFSVASRRGIVVVASGDVAVMWHWQRNKL
jgi:hypothetical protein